MWREIGDSAFELSAFAAKVAELSSAGKPVKIYPGCGDTIAADFLNVDISFHPKLLRDDVRWDTRDIFIFPFADMAWPIPSNCCDYVFHEDLFEHLTQRQQIGFLAEMLRILKSGGWHRINTPNLIASMKRHSSFELGYDGVYHKEWHEHGHVVVPSRAMITEMAHLVGYREIFFTMKNKPSSEHGYIDCRPGTDRDQQTGNIFADLLK